MLNVERFENLDTFLKSKQLISLHTEIERVG